MSTFTDFLDWPPGGVLSHRRFFRLTRCTNSFFVLLLIFTLGVSLSNQGRLPTQQRPPDRDHHQAPPHRRRRGGSRGGAQRRHLGRVRANKAGALLPPGRGLTRSPLVRQVPGPVQAGQSVREVHPGGLQERQRRVLQAQEQPSAGGAGALGGVELLLPARQRLGSRGPGGRGLDVEAPSRSQLVTSLLPAHQ